MKKTTLTALAATAALLVPSIGNAQDANAQTGVGVGVDAGAGVSAGGADVNAGAGANASTNAAAATAGTHDIGSIDDLVTSIGSSTTALPSITDSTKIKIVLTSSLQGDAAAGTDALSKTLTDNESAISDLRSKIGANSAIKAKLAAEGHAAEDVVAVTTAADGSVTVYVDDAE